jgi:hypothetical protein
MLRAVMWLGLYVGVPSVATYVTSVWLLFVDHFLVFFVFAVAVLLVAIVPRLLDAQPGRSSGEV